VLSKTVVILRSHHSISDKLSMCGLGQRHAFRCQLLPETLDSDLLQVLLVLVSQESQNVMVSLVLLAVAVIIWEVVTCLEALAVCCAKETPFHVGLDWGLGLDILGETGHVFVLRDIAIAKERMRSFGLSTSSRSPRH